MNCIICNNTLTPKYALLVAKGKAKPVCRICSGEVITDIADGEINGKTAYIAFWYVPGTYYIAKVKCNHRKLRYLRRFGKFKSYGDADETAKQLNKELGLSPRQAVAISLIALKPMLDEKLAPHHVRSRRA